MAKSKKTVKIKYKGRLIFLILILVLIIYLIIKGTMMTIGLFMGNELKFNKVATIDAKRTEENIVTLDTNINKQALAVASDDMTKLFDKEGKKLWETNIPAKDIKTGTDIIIVATQNTGEYILLDYAGQEIYRSNISEDIIDIKMNVDDKSILLFNKGYILINNNGEELTRLNIEDGQVIDGEFSVDNQQVLLDVLSVKNNGYDTNIITYDFEGNVVSGKTFKEKSCFDIETVNNDRVVLLSDVIEILDKNRDVENKNEGKLEGQITRFEVEDNSLNQEFNIYMSLISSDSSEVAVDPKSVFEVIKLNSKLEEIYTAKIPGEVKGIKALNNKLLVHSGRTVFVLDDKGKIILQKDINRDIIDIQWISDERFLLVDKAEITLVLLESGRK